MPETVGASWRFGPVSEADFEPLALRTAVMRNHLERIGRFTPERSRRVFRSHFDEPGLLRAKRIKQWTFYQRDEESIARIKAAIRLEL